MAHATFNSLRGEKSALIIVKAHALEFAGTAVYVPREGVAALTGKSIPMGEGVESPIAKGETFEIPDGFEIVDWVVNGEPRLSKTGEALQTLQW